MSIARRRTIATTVALCALFRTTLAQNGGPPRSKSANAAPVVDPQEFNFMVIADINITWVVLMAVFTIFFTVLRIVRHLRHMACLSNDTQGLFAIPNQAFAGLKAHIMNAPLLKTRHHREFRPSPKLNAGTPPGRFQALFLLAYYGANAVLGILFIDLSSATALDEIRNRMGVLAVVNLLPLMLLSTRNNPLINLFGVSFDSFNLLHRWFGRLVVLLALAHVLIYFAEGLQQQSLGDILTSIYETDFLLSGFIAVLGFLTIAVQASAVIRHAFYELFLHLHILLTALIIGALWFHLQGLPFQGILIGVIAIWGKERLFRLFRVIRRNVGRGGSRATVELLPGDAMRVTLRVARPWNFRPGQHIYLYIPSIGLWTSHPFSLAWSQDEEELSEEKGIAISTQDVLAQRRTTLNLVIKRRSGFTGSLWKKASTAPQERFSARCIVEGPYGGESLRSYGTVLLFAAGVGITHQVPHLRDLIEGNAKGLVATRMITMVWIVQSPEHLEWIRPWMTTILEMPERRKMLRILLFITRPRSPKELEMYSPSSSIQMFHGKPNVQALIDAEIEHQVGTMAVSVCGTGSLADDVRSATRSRMHVSNLDFIENAFSW